MNKQFESGGNITDNPFNVKIVKNTGEFEDYYLIKGDARDKITFAELIDEQVDFVKNKDIELCSSGDCNKIGSSGDYAWIGSSGDYAQIGSSGYSAWIGSSGYSARIGSSGYYARIGSSGDYAWIGSSGYSAWIGSSGDYARIGSSGDYARINVKGSSGVAFACGMDSIIKAKKGTWISLCEYENKDGNYIPVFALAAQIGNNDYVDCKGKVLNADSYYILKDKKFTPVIMDDGLILIKNSSKVINGIEVIKCKDLINSNKIFCVRKGELSAHGETLHMAISELAYKETKNRDTSEIVEKIKNVDM